MPTRRSPSPRGAAIKISTPADTVCAVPHLVGFHPASSLVIVCLTRPGSQVGLTMRYDLMPESDDDAFAADVVGRIEHSQATAVLLVAYPEVAAVVGGHLPRTALIDEIERRCLLADIRVKEALCVVDGRFWSYLCADPQCCPADGRPVPDAVTGPVGQLAALEAARGRAVLADREELERSIAPVTFLAARKMEQALAVADALSEVADPADALWNALELISDLVGRFTDPRTASMDDEEAASVIVALHDIETRDAVLAEAAACAECAERDEDGIADAGMCDTGVLDEYLAVFVELARRALPPYDAPTLTVLAWIAYARGNGALANVALDRARSTNPAYNLANLLTDALLGQVPPDAIRAAMLDASHGMRDWGV